jgi:hypothetical protein
MSDNQKIVEFIVRMTAYVIHGTPVLICYGLAIALNRCALLVFDVSEALNWCAFKAVNAGIKLNN